VAVTLTTPKASLLNLVSVNKNYSIVAPPNPTYWPTSNRKRADILEIFITNTPNHLYKNITNLLDPCSDHSPVLLSLNAIAKNSRPLSTVKWTG